MKSGEMKFIIGLIIVGVIILGIIWSKNHKKAENNQEPGEQNVVVQNEVEEKYVQQLPDGSKLNTSEQFKKEKKLDGLVITNIQFRETEGITKLLADVENKTDKKTEKKRVKIKVLDEKGNKLTEIRGIIAPIEAKGKTQLNMGVTTDVSNAYDFEISEE